MRRAALIGLLVGTLTSALWAADEVDTAGAQIMPSYHSSRVSGSRPRAGLYGRRYTGLTLSILDLNLLTQSGFDALDLWADDLWGDNYDGRLALWAESFPGTLRLEWDRAVFFQDPLAPAPAPSTRSNMKLTARARPATGWMITGTYSHGLVNYPSQTREGAARYNTAEFGGTLAVPLGRGTIEVHASNWDYRERAGLQPGSRTHQYGILYNAPLSSRWAVGAAARWATVAQPGFPNSDLFSARAYGYYQPAHNLTTELRLRFRDLDLGPTRNAYVTKSFGAAGQVTWHPIQPVRLRVGLERRDMERLNAVQSAVEKPHETRFWVRADYRGPRSLRATLKYDLRSLDNLPPSAAPLMGDPRSLFVNNDQRLDLRASAAVGAGGLAYGFWQHRAREDDRRGIRHTGDFLGVGASYPLSSRLTLAGDLYWQMIDTNQAALAGFDSDAFVAHVGCGWNPARRLRLSADYSRVEGYFGEDADRNLFACGLDWDLAAGGTLRLSFQRDEYESTLFTGQDYDADLLNVSYLASF